MVSVTDIYINGNVTLMDGSAGLGSSSDPGNISVNGDMTLWNGERDVYGDVYVNGSFMLKDAHIHGDVYVDGDVVLNWTPTLDSDSNIYYTGSFYYPSDYKKHQDILDKCIKVPSVRQVVMPGYEIPQAKDNQWYYDHGYEYMSSGDLSNGIWIFGPSYTDSDKWQYSSDSTKNVVIVATTGDITLNSFWDHPVTGVLFAPNGKVTFSGSSFEGLVIAKKGFYVSSGGTHVVFKNLDVYISNPNDYPF